MLQVDRWESKRLSFPLVPFSFHMGSMKEGLGVRPPANTTSLKFQKKRQQLILLTEKLQHWNVWGWDGTQLNQQKQRNVKKADKTPGGAGVFLITQWVWNVGWETGLASGFAWEAKLRDKYSGQDELTGTRAAIMFVWTEIWQREKGGEPKAVQLFL